MSDSKPPNSLPTTSTEVTGLLTPASPYATSQPVTTCLRKTAVAPIIVGHTKTIANILFDEGAQRSFVSSHTVKELGITLTSTADIPLASFGNTARTNQRLGIVTVELETLCGELVPSLLIGTDHYWDLVQDNIVRGEGPTPRSRSWAIYYQDDCHALAKFL